MSLLSLCNSTADIYRPVMTADSHGGYAPISGAALYASIPISLQPANGRLVEEFSRRGLQITHTMYTPTAITLKAGDFATIASKNYIVVWFEDQAGRNRVYAAHLLQKD